MASRLERSIGLLQATAMVVGTIVGASIFVQPSEVSRAVPSLAGMLLVWLAAGALTWFGASICAELSSVMPRTGGVYVFLREMFSPACGFLWGWAMFWSMLGHHRGDRDGVRPLRRDDRTAGRSRRPSRRRLGHSGAVGDQLLRRAARQRGADGADDRENRRHCRARRHPVRRRDRKSVV